MNIVKTDGLLPCTDIFNTNNSKSSIENYIDYLNDQHTSISDGSIGIFKDAIIYYGDQFCTNLILSCSNTDTGFGIYNSNCSKVNVCDVITETYKTTLQHLINDEYNDTKINYTLIITACRLIRNTNTRSTTYNSDPNLNISPIKKVFNFYKGLNLALLRAIPLHAGVFLGYELSKKYLV